LKNQNWKKYTFEFLSIFIAVVSAFALSNWNDNRNSKQSEQKILTEIKNSIEIDIRDFNNNIGGNKLSLKANKKFRNLIENKEVSQDSIGFYYTLLFRDYVPIINKSAYESFKANNLKNRVEEMKSFDNYYSAINTKLYPYMEFNKETGSLTAIQPPKNLTEMEKKEILSYLWRIRNNRNYKLGRYETIIKYIEKVKLNIEKEIKKR